MTTQTAPKAAQARKPRASKKAVAQVQVKEDQDMAKQNAEQAAPEAQQETTAPEAQQETTAPEAQQETTAPEAPRVTFEVVGISEDETISVLVTRAGDAYESEVLNATSIEKGVVGKGKSADAAISNLMKRLTKKTENNVYMAFAFDGAGAEKAQAPKEATEAEAAEAAVSAKLAGSNTLGAYVSDVVQAAEQLEKAEGDTIAASRAIGQALTNVKQEFDAIVKDSNLDAQGGLKAWGRFRAEKFSDNPAALKHIITRKNFAGQAMLMASAPETAVRASGAETASTFEKNVNAFGNEIGKRQAEAAGGAEKIRAMFSTNDKGYLYPVQGKEREAYGRVVAVCVMNLRDIIGRMQKAESEARAKAERAHDLNPSKPLAYHLAKLFDATARDKEGGFSFNHIPMIEWLFGLDVLTDELLQQGPEAVFDAAATLQFMDADKGKVALPPQGKFRGIGNLLRAFQGLGVAKVASEEKADKAANEASAIVKKAFADWDVTDAAMHLFNMLKIHPEADDVMALLEQQWQDEKAAKAGKAESETADGSETEEAQA